MSHGLPYFLKILFVFLSIGFFGQNSAIKAQIDALPSNQPIDWIEQAKKIKVLCVFAAEVSECEDASGSSSFSTFCIAIRLSAELLKKNKQKVHFLVAKSYLLNYCEKTDPNLTLPVPLTIHHIKGTHYFYLNLLEHLDPDDDYLQRQDTVINPQALGASYTLPHANLKDSDVLSEHRKGLKEWLQSCRPSWLENSQVGSILPKLLHDYRSDDFAWNVMYVGHGGTFIESSDATIGGIEKRGFLKDLSFFRSMNVKNLYLTSCCAGGITRRFIEQEAQNEFPYTIVVFSNSDSPVSVNPESLFFNISSLCKSTDVRLIIGRSIEGVVGNLQFSFTIISVKFPLHEDRVLSSLPLILRSQKKYFEPLLPEYKHVVMRELGITEDILEKLNCWSDSNKHCLWPFVRYLCKDFIEQCDIVGNIVDFSEVGVVFSEQDLRNMIKVLF